jgi:hypothetical protein
MWTGKQLNNLTIENTFLISLIDELLDELNGFKYFSKLDLRIRYLQVRISEENVDK